MASGGEKTGDDEKQQKETSKAASFDLNDYTVIKEGEAEILMHAKNEVFYNKTQVNNRDMSIAVLRAFIAKRKLEHEAVLSKRTKTTAKVSDKPVIKPEIPEESISEDGKSNGQCETSEETCEHESCSISEKMVDNLEEKSRGELKPPRVLEALSASGLRALRYAREVEGIGQVVALDNDKVSVEACRRNIKFNGSVACSKVESHLADARVYMLTHPKEFDVVDLDPYGSPSVFLDSAVQSVVDGGILMCTATDLAVLCGGNGEVCYSKYGSYPLRGKYCHEMALRILLASIESHANRYKRYIVPVLSVQMDFYVRVFVRVYTSASAMKNTPLKLSYVYQCTGCDSFHLQPIGRTVAKNTSVRYLPGFGPVVPQECNDCGKKYNMGGPIWSAPIHDQEWVTSILEDVKSMKDRYPAYDRISAVLTTISEELPDIPLFLSLHNLCATLKCTSPSAVIFRSAVINAGYRISGAHVNPLGLKTDAPMDVIWDIMRCWVKNHPVKAQPPDQAGSVILAKEPVLQANFARAVASLSKAQAKKVARFLPNPERHWGPKLRAGRQITSKHVSLLGVNAVNGASQGFAVCAIDHQGHGFSEGLQSHIPDINPVVDDCISFFDSFRERHAPPDSPAFLYAESLGGAIALLITLRRDLKRQYDGVVLNGAMCGVSDKIKPPWPLEHFLSIVAAVVPTWRVVPTRGRLPEVSFKVEWKRKLAIASPRRPLARPRAATAQELLRVSRELQARFNEVTVPFLIVHGGDDIICDPACAEELYKRAASKDKTVKIYPGMWHQLVGESDEDVERVFGDVVQWLRTRAERCTASSLRNENATE